MPKVLCTLPNASSDIGGIKFEQHAKGMLSEDISDEQAKRLASIPGYEIVGAASAPVDPYAAERAAAALKAEADRIEAERLETERASAEKAEAERVEAEQRAATEKADAERQAAQKAEAEKAGAAERADLEAKAAAVGLKVKGSWGNERLKAEIETAEQAAAEQKAEGKSE